MKVPSSLRPAPELVGGSTFAAQGRNPGEEPPQLQLCMAAGSKHAREKPLPGVRRGFSRGAFDKLLAVAGQYSRCPILKLPAKLVEFPTACAAEKCMPFTRSEPEHRAGRVLGIADADPAIGQAGHLDTVAVGKTQRTLDPEQA